MDCNWLHKFRWVCECLFVQHMYLALDPIPAEEIPFCLVQRRRKSRRLKVLINSYSIRTSSYRPVSYKFLTCSDVLIANSPFDGYKKCVFLRCLWSHSSCDWGNGCAKCLGGGWAFVTQYPVARKECPGDLVRSWECLNWISVTQQSWLRFSQCDRSELPMEVFFQRMCHLSWIFLGCFCCFFHVAFGWGLSELIQLCVFGFKSGLRPCQVAICRAAL